MGNSKKQKLNERGKKILHAKLECHLVGPHALSHEVSAYIYIYILILIAFPGFILSILHTIDREINCIAVSMSFRKMFDFKHV